MRFVLDHIWEILLSGGSGATVAIFLFKHYGQKWIESKFEKQLEEARHEHAKELQQLRNKLDSELNRMTKVLEKEFTVLPEAWGLLDEASAIVSYTVSLGRMIPNFDKMNQNQFEEYLKNCPFSESQKEDFRNSTNKHEFYNNLIFFYEQKDAKKAVRKFHIFIKKNSIFLRPSLKKSFLEIDDKMWSSLITREVSYGEPTITYKRMAREIMEKEVQPMIGKLEEEIHVVLHKGDFN